MTDRMSDSTFYKFRRNYSREDEADRLLIKAGAGRDPEYPAYARHDTPRHYRWREPGDIAEFEIIAPDPFTSLEAMDMVDSIMREAKLTDRERCAYALHHYAQAPPPDGAKLMGVSLRSYFDYRANAQRKLAAVVAEKEGEHDG